MGVDMDSSGTRFAIAMLGLLLITCTFALGLGVGKGLDDGPACIQEALDAEVNVRVSFYEPATDADLEYLAGCGFE